MTKILTLGAAGVLGSEITRQLESLPDVEQICCDVRSLPYRRKNGTNVQANAREKSQLVPLVKGQSVNSRFVSRAAVAKLITRIVTEPTQIYRNESIGITS